MGFRLGIEVSVEVVFTDEGDWSLALEYGAQRALILPANNEYTRFTVLQETPHGLAVVFEDEPLDESLDWVA